LQIKRFWKRKSDTEEESSLTELNLERSTSRYLEWKLCYYIFGI